MTTLTKAKRDDAKSLLEDHQLVCDALEQVGKASWHSALMVTNEKDGADVVVGFYHAIAKKALTEQKEWTERELGKLGIEIK